jgi:RNA methyltransferase, TrmH family
MRHVTSRHNPSLKEAARLIASSRDRRKAGKCVLEGEHLVTAYAQRHGAPESIVVTDEALAQKTVNALAQRYADRVLVVTEKLLSELAVLPAGVGMLAVVPAQKPERGPAADFCLLLDDIQDPGNVGSMLRSAAAAGVGQVWMSKNCAFAWSPKVLRAGQGAHFYLDIFEDVDLVTWAADYRSKGGEVIAMVAAGGTSLYEARLAGRIAVAIGNEGAGLAAGLMGQSTQRLTIPMPGGIESLNAAVATGICLFECVRRRVSRID